LTAFEKAAQAAALVKLEAALALGAVSVVVGAQGSVAFKGWQAEERGGLSDLCAYRRLAGSNSPALRRAVARAEALAGRKVDAHAVAHGHHSHDGGQTWSKH
jgi:hypothetical protein